MQTAADKDHGLRAELNVTPLVDVVLVLLIIFMVLTPAMLKHLAAKVPNKPDQAVAAPAVETSIVVEYDARRKVLLNREPVELAMFEQKLAQRLRGARQKVVFFRADDDVPYGEVVHLMDAARGAGAQTLAVVTEPYANK